MVLITFLQGWKRDTGIDNRLGDIVGEGEGGMKGQIQRVAWTNIYYHM